MDREELERIRLLSDNITEELQNLQGEIRNYKSGAESFMEATEGLEKIYNEQETIVRALTEYLSELSKNNSKRELEDFSRRGKEIVAKLERNLEKFKTEQGEIKEILEESVKKITEEERETRKEVRRTKQEIFEKIEKLEEVKGRRSFRLFGKK